MDPRPLLIFDYGGVISPHGKGLQGIDTILGIQFDKSTHPTQHALIIDVMYGRISIAELEHKLQSIGHHNVKNVEARWQAWAKEHFVPAAGMQDLFEALQGRGYRLALLSNNTAPSMSVLRSEGWLDPFGVVVASNEVHMAKPEVEIFQHTLNLLGATAEHCLFIDDKQSNTAVAAELGMQVLTADGPAHVIKWISEKYDLNHI